MTSAWLFQNPFEIEDFLEEENKSSEPLKEQKLFVIQKINFCLIHYLLTQCSQYQIIVKNLSENDFIDIETISRSKKILFDHRQYSNKNENERRNETENNNDNNNNINNNNENNENNNDNIKLKRKQQIKTMAQIFLKESQMKLIFNDDENDFQLVKFLDENNEPFSLTTLFEEFGNYKEFENFIIRNQEFIERREKRKEQVVSIPNAPPIEIPEKDQPTDEDLKQTKFIEPSIQNFLNRLEDLEQQKNQHPMKLQWIYQNPDDIIPQEPECSIDFGFEDTQIPDEIIEKMEPKDNILDFVSK